MHDFRVGVRYRVSLFTDPGVKKLLLSLGGVTELLFSGETISQGR